LNARPAGSGRTETISELETDHRNFRCTAQRNINQYKYPKLISQGSARRLVSCLKLLFDKMIARFFSRLIHR
jgi:hypothetical protein